MTLNIVFSVVSHEPVELEKEPVENPRLQENYRSFERNLWNTFQKLCKKTERSQHVGHGDTRILTDYAQKSPGTWNTIHKSILPFDNVVAIYIVDVD